MSRYNNYNNANGRVIKTENARILCLADIRGQLSSLNTLAQQHDATHILHTGDFGFYDKASLDRMSDRILRHVIQYSPLVPHATKNGQFNASPSNDISNLRRAVQSSEQSVISELQDFLDGKKQLQIPVFTVYGACEDVRVLEQFRSQEYKITNLNIVDEAGSKLVSIGGLNLRLLGLGGSVLPHKLFDNGEGKGTIAGGQGTMWTTALQIGELLHTADRTYSTSETRILMTHPSPGREGLLSQLAQTVKADFTLSASLHFRYGSSYNEYSVCPSHVHYAQKLAASRSNFMSIYDVVKPELTTLLTPPQAQLLQTVLAMVEAMPKDPNDVNSNNESFKNLWNFNLPDAQFGSLVLDIKDGRVSEEMRSQGFNFNFRRGTDHKADREKQRTVSQAQGPASQDGKGKLPASSVPSIQAAPSSKPQLSQTAQNATTGSKADKANTPPVPKAVKSKQTSQNAMTGATPPISAGEPTSAEIQQIATETPLPAPSSSTPAPSSANGRDTPAQTGLWVSPCESQDRAKELFPNSVSADLKHTNTGRHYAYVFFSSSEEMNNAMTAWDQKEDKLGVLVKEISGSIRQPGGNQRGRGRGRGGSGRGGRGGRGRGAAAPNVTET